MLPLDDETRQIAMAMLLWGVLPALAAASVVMAALEWLGGAKQAPAAATLALISGAVLGLWLVAAAPLYKMDDPAPLLSTLGVALKLDDAESTWNRLPWAVLAALCVERLARILDMQTQDGWLLRGAAAVGIAWWLIPEPTRATFVWLAPGFAGVVFLEWELLQRLAAEPPGGGVLLCLALALVVAGIVLLFAGLGRGMEIAVISASALAGIGLVAWWRRADASGAVPAGAVILPSLLLMAHQGTSVETIPWTAFATAALAPLMLAGTWPVRHWPAIGRLFAGLFLILIPLLAAVLLAQQGATEGE
jgi:hypothetical protein